MQEIGPSNMAWMTYTSERFDSRRAKEIGLINEVVENTEELTRRSLELANAIAANAPLALRAAKKLKRRLQDAFLDEGMLLAEEVRAPLDETQDCVEGLTAFREKRVPRFKGR
jgi:E-phenylitaconyl-CoA hydratase